MLRQERNTAQQAQDQLQAAEKELEHLRGSQEQLENAEKVQNRCRAYWEYLNPMRAVSTTSWPVE